MLFFAAKIKSALFPVYLKYLDLFEEFNGSKLFHFKDSSHKRPKIVRKTLKYRQKEKEECKKNGGGRGMFYVS
jgi:hypothetical protein